LRWTRFLKIWIIFLPMTARTITARVNAAPLVCSEFRRGRNYTNWRPEGSGDWLLIYTVAGRGLVRSGRRSLHTGPGAAVLFSPVAVQDYLTEPTTGYWHLRWAHFKPRALWQTWLRWPEIAPGTGYLNLKARGVSDAIVSALERMLVASRLERNGGIDLAMNALEEVLIWAFGTIAGKQSERIDDRVQRAVNLLASDPSRPFALSALAAHCGLSVSRFCHLFKRNLKITPQKFSEKLRFELAQQLLVQTNLSVFQVASEVGFPDQFYFSRRFRAITGRTPSSLRRQTSLTQGK
jgi:AraC family transcriptional regulator of arabinose operon